MCTCNFPHVIKFLIASLEIKVTEIVLVRKSHSYLLTSCFIQFLKQHQKRTRRPGLTDVVACFKCVSHLSKVTRNQTKPLTFLKKNYALNSPRLRDGRKMVAVNQLSLVRWAPGLVGQKRNARTNPLKRC